MVAGPPEVLAAVLDRQHQVAVRLGVRVALAVAAALLGDREVEADPGAVVPGEVLLPGLEPGVVGPVDEQRGSGVELASWPSEVTPTGARGRQSPVRLQGPEAN